MKLYEQYLQKVTDLKKLQAWNKAVEIAENETNFWKCYNRYKESSKFADEKKLGECEKRVTELANKIYHKMGY